MEFSGFLMHRCGQEYPMGDVSSVYVSDRNPVWLLYIVSAVGEPMIIQRCPGTPMAPHLHQQTSTWLLPPTRLGLLWGMKGCNQRLTQSEGGGASNERMGQLRWRGKKQGGASPHREPWVTNTGEARRRTSVSESLDEGMLFMGAMLGD